MWTLIEPPSDFPDYVEDDPGIYAFQERFDEYPLGFVPVMPVVNTLISDTGNTVEPVKIRKNFADVWIWQSIGRRWVPENWCHVFCTLTHCYFCFLIFISWAKASF